MVLLMLLIFFIKAFMWTAIVAEENVAYGKLCNQSSYTGSNSAFLAVDGNDTTCFKSNYTGYQWMYVDLLWKYHMQRVTLYGIVTTDYLRIFLTNSEDTTSETYLTINCSLVYNGSYKGGKMAQFNCPKDSRNFMRYVVVVQSKVSLHQLVICEIDAIGSWAELNPKRDNVLYKKPANNFYNDTGINNPSQAVDGIRDTNLDHGFCYEAQGYGYSYGWIKIDMLESYIIDYVAVTTRNLSYAAPRMSYNFGFSDYDFKSLTRVLYPVCAQSFNVTAGIRVTLQCNANLPAYRFFFVQQPNEVRGRLLNICEIEAYTPLNKNSKIWKVVSRDGIPWLVKHKDLVSSTAVQCSVYCSNYKGDSFSFNAQKKLCRISYHPNGIYLIFNAGFKDWNTWISVYA